jgi:putative endopeptidase
MTADQQTAPRSDTTLDGAPRPQDDLYRHVNAAWLASTTIPDDRAAYGTAHVLVEQAEEQLRAICEEAAAALDDEPAPDHATTLVGALYRSFTDADAVERLGVTPIEADLAAIREVTTLADLPGLLGRLQRDGVSGVVQPFVDTDDGDPDRVLVHLEQAGLGLPDESYYREDGFAPIRDAYRAHLQRMFALIGAADAAAHADRVLALETALASHHWDRVRCRDAVQTYTLLSRPELDALAPQWDWSAWLEAVGAGRFPDALAQVVARQPSFLTGAAQVLAGASAADLQSWLTWQLVRSTAGLLTDALVTEHFDFYGRTLTGAPQLRPRWKRAVAFVEGCAGEALGQVYVSRHFPPAAKDRMLVLVDHLVEAYRRDIVALDWMGEQTKEKALTKLAAFRAKIGYPDRWRDYQGLTAEPGDVVGNWRRASAFETDRELAKLGRPVDRDEWFMTPQTVNAYYNSGMNEIVFPAAILQPPFFDLDADDAANYGAIGAVIGHEIGHGFDDQGSRYDGRGALVDWWTEEDRARFDALSQRLIAQYDEFAPAEAPDHRVNGALTVGENIGDLGGVTVGYQAYVLSLDGREPPVIDGHTGAQRFFRAWARAWATLIRPEEQIRRLTIDPHSPAEFRCNVVRNLDEFVEAYGVTEGDGLWLAPEDRVRIW